MHRIIRGNSRGTTRIEEASVRSRCAGSHALLCYAMQPQTVGQNRHRAMWRTKATPKTTTLQGVIQSRTGKDPQAKRHAGSNDSRRKFAVLLLLLPPLATRAFAWPSIAVQQVRKLAFRPPQRRRRNGSLVLRRRRAVRTFRLQRDNFHLAFALPVAIRRWMHAEVQHARGLERCGCGGGRRGFRDGSGQVGGEVLMSPAIDESGPKVATDRPLSVRLLARDRARRGRAAEVWIRRVCGGEDQSARQRRECDAR